jgi:hypothetical protein
LTAWIEGFQQKVMTKEDKDACDDRADIWKGWTKEKLKIKLR